MEGEYEGDGNISLVSVWYMNAVFAGGGAARAVNGEVFGFSGSDQAWERFAAAGALGLQVRGLASDASDERSYCARDGRKKPHDGRNEL